MCLIELTDHDSGDKITINSKYITSFGTCKDECQEPECCKDKCCGHKDYSWIQLVGGIEAYVTESYDRIHELIVDGGD